VYSGPLWTVEDVVLVQSWPGEGRRGGPAYEVLETFGLGGAGGDMEAGPAAPAP
jgi:hypothetical protein